MERGVLGVCGSISAEVIGYGPRLPVAGETLQGSELLIASGGKGANQAVAAARLGARVRLTGARGADAFGELCASALAADGVALDRVAVHDDTHTGVALICVGEDGESQILALPGANGRCLPPEPCGARVWLCQAELPQSANAGVLAAAQQDGAFSVINPSPTHTIDRELLARFDLAVVNEAEAKALEGFLPEARVVTLGAAGALLLPEGDELPGLDVTAIDATGAGDALCGTFAGGLAAGLPRRQALARAIVAAGISVERRGCQSSYASRTEVERRLRW